MTTIELPLDRIKQAILSPDASFSDGIGRFTCRNRLALTIDEWLILIDHQSFQFSKSSPASEWKARDKSTLPEQSLTLIEVVMGEKIIALAAHHKSSQPLVKLLHIGGMPPHSIQRDWQKQLARTGKVAANVCQALCDSDGILTVIPDLHENTTHTSPLLSPLSNPTEMHDSNTPGLQNWRPISWPWHTPNHAKTSFTEPANPNFSKTNSPALNPTIPALAAATKSSTTNKSSTTSKQTDGTDSIIPTGQASNRTANLAAASRDNSKPIPSKPTPSKITPAKASHRKKIVVGTILAASLIAIPLIWKGLQSSTPPQNADAITKNSPAPLLSGPSLTTDPASSDDELAPEILAASSDADMSELGSSDSLPPLDSLTSELDSFAGLESQLQDKLVLKELDTTNIIARSLNSQQENAVTPESVAEIRADDAIVSPDKNLITTDDIKDDPQDDDSTKNLDANALIDPATASANSNRKDRLSVALKKEKISLGFSVVPKDAQWSAQLVVEDPLPKSLVVAPDDRTQMIGPGKVTWVLGLEDEDPELIVEILAKPGRRWDLIWQVGFRESREDAPRLLGPKDANQVLDQLTSAKAFVARMLTLNQMARDSRVRGPVDLFEQRNQLQRQDRELEQSIERWKTISSLSQIVFRQSQVEFQAVAPNTPATNAEESILNSP